MAVMAVMAVMAAMEVMAVMAAGTTFSVAAARGYRRPA